MYVVAPVFGPGQRRYDLSPEEGAASHRIEITEVAGRKLAALACHASQTDIAEEIAELRAALDRDGVDLRGLHPRPPHRPAASPDLLLPPRLRRSPLTGLARQFLLDWSAMTIDSNLAKVDEVMTALYDIHDPEIGMSIVDLDLIKNVEIGVDGAPTEIKMVLTTPFCPWAGELIQTMKTEDRGGRRASRQGHPAGRPLGAPARPLLGRCGPRPRFDRLVPCVSALASPAARSPRFAHLPRVDSDRAPSNCFALLYSRAR